MVRATRKKRNNLGVPEADAKQAFGSSVEQLKTQGFLIQVFCGLKNSYWGLIGNQEIHYSIQGLERD